MYDPGTAENEGTLNTVAKYLWNRLFFIGIVDFSNRILSIQFNFWKKKLKGKIFT